MEFDKFIFLNNEIEKKIFHNDEIKQIYISNG